MPYATNPAQVTAMFHVLSSEVDKIKPILEARGIGPKAPSAVFFPALIEELDKLIPSAKLAERMLTDHVGVAICRSLPDSRWTTSTAGMRPPVDVPVEKAPDQQGNLRPAMKLSQVAKGSSIEQKISALVVEPLPEADVEQMRKLSAEAGVPYPTHAGVLKLDDKAELRVYQLNNGQRIIDLEDLQRFFGTFGGI